MFDRYLSGSTAKLSVIEAYEMYSATSLFQTKLEQPIIPSERDALWATAAFLGISAFFYVEGDTIEETWPLKPSSVMDLNVRIFVSSQKAPPHYQKFLSVSFLSYLDNAIAP